MGCAAHKVTCSQLQRVNKAQFRRFIRQHAIYFQRYTGLPQTAEHAPSLTTEQCGLMIRRNALEPRRTDEPEPYSGSLVVLCSLSGRSTPHETLVVRPQEVSPQKSPPWTDLCPPASHDNTKFTYHQRWMVFQHSSVQKRMTKLAGSRR